MDSPRVLLEDAKAQKLIKLFLAILRHRVSSYAWHDSAYPGALAMLVHEDSEMVKAGLQRFRLHAEAVEWMKTDSATYTCFKPFQKS